MTWHDGSHPLENFAIPENLFLHRVLFIFLAFSARFFHQCPIKSFIYICITSILKICCDLLKNICNRFVGLDSDRPKKKRRKLTKDDIELVYASAQGSKLKGTVCPHCHFFYSVRTLSKNLLAHMVTSRPRLTGPKFFMHWNDWFSVKTYYIKTAKVGKSVLSLWLNTTNHPLYIGQKDEKRPKCQFLLFPLDMV